MLKLHESAGGIGIGAAGALGGDGLAELRRVAAEALALPRGGDVFRFSQERAAIEVIVGFRPGIDRVFISGSSRALLTQDGSDAVVVDVSRNRIVLQGVTLAELLPGDVVLS